MKILCEKNYKYLGLKTTLEYCGHEVLWCEGVIFDTFQRFQPDMYFGAVSSKIRDIDRAIQKYQTKYTIFEESAESQVKNHLTITKKDLLVADIISYYCELPTLNSDFESDVCFIGEYTLRRYSLLKRLCDEGLHNVKVFGNGEWPKIPQHLGLLQTNQAKGVYGSSVITLEVFDETEPSLLNCIVASGFPICDKNSLTDLPIETFKSYDELLGLVKLYTKSPQSRSYEAKKIVLKKYTWFDLTAKLFEKLGMKDEGKKIRKKKREFLDA